MINIKLLKKSSAKAYIIKYLNTLKIEDYSPLFDDIFNDLRDDILFLIEQPYIDKLYRDSYYQYFATKLATFERNCIRVSLFNKNALIDKKEYPIHVELFNYSNQKNLEILRSAMLGYFIVRPLSLCIGRNLINPKALKRQKQNFFLRTVNSTVTINGLKIPTIGFYHSSQDSETMTCSQTTVWALMEYFGTRYSDYSTTLPSEIKSILNSNSFEQRLLPAPGLVMESISLLLKKFGFGTVVYSPNKKQKGKTVKDDDFFRKLNLYIESGIPVVIGLANKKIGHVYLGVGRKWIPNGEFKKLKKIQDSKVEIYDFDSAERELIIVDDNYPPYQKANPLTPVEYYKKEPDWKGCTIDAFIVPLHKKVYLEGNLAKSCFIRFVESAEKNNIIGLIKNRKNYIRCFLTSSRTFKAFAQKSLINNKYLRNLIVKTSLPQFVYIVEITSQELIEQKKADGIVMIDATEPQVENYKPIILAAMNDNIISLDPLQNSTLVADIDVKKVSLQPFYMFNRNLKLFDGKL